MIGEKKREYKKVSGPLRLEWIKMTTGEYLLRKICLLKIYGLSIISLIHRHYKGMNTIKALFDCL